MEKVDLRHKAANSKNPVKSSTGSRAIQRALNIRKALAMRMRNMTLTEIAEKLHVTPTCVYYYIRDGIKDLPKENAEELKFILNTTLQTLIQKTRPGAMMGFKEDSDTLLKAIDKLMKLEGLHTIKNEVVVDNVKTVVGEGIDISELDLPLETQKQILEAIKRKNAKDIKNDKIESETQAIPDRGDQQDN